MACCVMPVRSTNSCPAEQAAKQSLGKGKFLTTDWRPAPHSFADQKSVDSAVILVIGPFRNNPRADVRVERRQCCADMRAEYALEPIMDAIDADKPAGLGCRVARSSAALVRHRIEKGSVHRGERLKIAD